MTKDLQLFSYKGSDATDEEVDVQGLLLIYKDFKAVYAIEERLATASDLQMRKRQIEAFNQLKQGLC